VAEDEEEEATAASSAASCIAGIAEAAAPRVPVGFVAAPGPLGAEGPEDARVDCERPPPTRHVDASPLLRLEAAAAARAASWASARER
jgi:hypothetical protein